MHCEKLPLLLYLLSLNVLFLLSVVISAVTEKTIYLNFCMLHFLLPLHLFDC